MNQLAAPPTRSDLVRSLYTVLAAGDLAEVRQVLHPDVVLHVPGTHPLAGAHRGPDAVVRFMAASRSLTDGGEHIELVDVLEGRDHVGVYCTVRASRSGRPALVNRTVHLLRFDGDAVTAIWLHNFDDLSVNDFWS